MVSDIDYLWSDIFQKKPEIDDSVLNKYDIEQLIEVQGKEANTSLKEKCFKEGLILKDDIVDTEEAFKGIKFYIILNYAIQVPQKSILEELKNYLRSDLDKKITIYSGSGYAKFFVKGVVGIDKLYSIADFGLNLTTKFKMIKMKASTVIVASPKAFESDNVNFGNIAFHSELTNILDELNLEKKDVQDFNKYESRLIQDKFESLKTSGLYQQYQTIFKPLFQGYIKKNSHQIIEKLYILSEFDRDFRKLSIKIMNNQFGDDWSNTAFAVVSESVGLSGKKIETIGLNDWISILGKVDAQSGLLSKIFSNHNNWEQVLRTAASLRNQYAHARIENPLEIWSHLIDFLAEWLPIYDSIKKELS